MLYVQNMKPVEVLITYCVCECSFYGSVMVPLQTDIKHGVTVPKSMELVADFLFIYTFGNMLYNFFHCSSESHCLILR